MKDRHSEAVAIGRRIRELRERNGWSQDTFAQKVGVDHSHFGMWERGDHIPRVLVLARICDVGGCTMDWVCGRVEPLRPQPAR